MLKKINFISKIYANVMVVVMGVVIACSNIALDNAGAITAFLGQANQEIIQNPNSDIDTLYHPSDYESIEQLKENAKNITSKKTEEGAVLLKNSNNALPLSNGAKINLYSSSSVNYIYSGGGSSFAKNSEFISLKEGLESSGFVVNADLWNWYSTNKQYFGDHTTNTSSDAAKYTINDAKWSDISTASKNNEAEAGIFVLSRYGTEATDLTATGGSRTDYSNGNYLELSPTEIDVLKNLKALKASGKIKKIIVLLNSVNQVQADYINSANYDIDSILWVGEGGTSTTLGIGKILSGKVNPSGKITDTFYKKHYYNPVYSNFGDYANVGPVISSANGGKSNHYVVYQEGIYTGYRYTETRYEDVVLNTKNVGEFNYNSVVAYPFGYGLSYTNFEYSNFKVKYDDKEDKYLVSVTVKNVGKVSCKESVQIYAQQPYTDYDVKNGIEKSAVDLVGYNKTDILAPGKSEELSVSVDGRWLSSYDSHNAKTYIQDAGTYYLTAAKNANSAINNILEAKKNKGISVNSSKMTSSGDKNLVYSFDKEFDNQKYSTSKKTNNKIINQFDNADLNLYENRGDNSVVYISRSNWENTVKYGISESQAKLSNYVVINTNSGMVNDAKKAADSIQKDDVKYPTFGKNNGLTLASLLTIGVDGKIEHVDYDDPDQDSSPIQYPCAALIASTMNDKLVEELGESIGEDCLWAGYSGLYGLGVNIHRGAYNGRAFEYYGEDSVLSGYIAAAQVKGIHKKGVYVYMKHAILNEQEKNREGVNTWCNEQAIRQIYLRSFQIAIEEANAENVMTGFNRIGLTWTSQQGFINTVLRDEFGMEGFAVSDYWQDGYMDLVGGILGGSALPDGDKASTAEKSPLYKYKEGYGKLANAMREETHRILYVVVNSNAMNGIDSSTIYRSITPLWIKQLNVAQIVIYVLASIGIATYVGTTIAIEVFEFKDKRKKNKDCEI